MKKRYKDSEEEAGGYIRPYEALANAIVLQAVEDYRDALGHLSRFSDDAGSLTAKREIERFFRSGWYRTLTTVNGEMLIQKLNEETAK